MSLIEKPNARIEDATEGTDKKSSKLRNILDILRGPNKDYEHVIRNGQIWKSDLFRLISESSLLDKSEKRVLLMALDGDKHEEIGQDLNVAKSTVDTYAYNVLQKLGLERMTELKALVMDSQPVTLDELIAGSKRVNQARIAVSKRQLRLAGLLAEGKTVKMAAEEIGITEPEARIRKQNLFAQLGITNTDELLEWHHTYEQYMRLIARQSDSSENKTGAQETL
jgi:DNA-binding NarL/FixJ family response regulator